MKRCLILMLLLGLLLTGCRKQTQPEQLPTAETIDTQANTEPAAQTPAHRAESKSSTTQTARKAAETP